jgi:CheY-like chemotaxis protein
VLVVDDDIRNIFALTSLLEQHEMTVRYAESGPEGIDLLEKNPSIELALVDIMMPGMDGYEVMRNIRESSEHAKLPIIAVTAKAMKGDREKCIEAGASDYITKPIDTETPRTSSRSRRFSRSSMRTSSLPGQDSKRFASFSIMTLPSFCLMCRCRAWMASKPPR